MESIQNDFAALPVTNDGKIEAPSMNQVGDILTIQKMS